MQISVEEKKGLLLPRFIKLVFVLELSHRRTVRVAFSKEKKLNPDGPKIREDPDSPPHSSDENYDVETPTKPKARPGLSDAKQKASVKLSRSTNKNKVRQQFYCTQACLLKFVRKGPLDESCPNVNAHRIGDSNHHALKSKHIAKLVIRQIAVNPENGCQPLNKQGARCALFKIVLKSYDYTFVAKETVPAYVPHLKHESSIYRRLAQIQGTSIPVYLGSVSMIRPYFLDVGVRIIHMLLMSWRGEEVDSEHLSDSQRFSFYKAIGDAVNELRQHGVEHRDTQEPNVLWNDESANVRGKE